MTREVSHLSNNLKFNIAEDRSRIFNDIIMSWSFSLDCIRPHLFPEEADFIEKHDIEVHNLTHEIEKNLLEMETGQRGMS